MFKKMFLPFLLSLSLTAGAAPQIESKYIKDNAITGAKIAPAAVNLSTHTTGILSVLKGGTGETTSSGSLNALLPSQTGNNGKVLQTDGSNTSWATAGGGITTMAAVGSSPNANGATISGITLNLEPASASFPGVITTGAQTIAGDKTFDGVFAATTTVKLGPGVVDLYGGGVTNESPITMFGVPPSADTNRGMFTIADTRALAAGNGGSIAFAAKYFGASPPTFMATISGINEDGVSNSTNGALVFKTRSDGFGIQEYMRITSLGKIGIGTTTPAATLDIVVPAGTFYGIDVNQPSNDIVIRTTSNGHSTTFGAQSTGGVFFGSETNEVLKLRTNNVVQAELSTAGVFKLNSYGAGVSVFDGSGNVSSVAPGTSGNVLTSNGTTWTSTAPSGSSFPLLGSAGSAAAPTYSFSGDSNTGMYNFGADILGFTTSGSVKWKINSTGNLIPAISGTYAIGESGLNASEVWTDTVKSASGILAFTGSGGIRSSSIHDFATAGIRLNYDAGGFYVGMIAPVLTANYTLTMPVDDGTSGQALTTNGSGVLSWATSGTTFPLLAPNGTAALPSYSFSTTPETGMSLDASNFLILVFDEQIISRIDADGVKPGNANRDLGSNTDRWRDIFSKTFKVHDDVNDFDISINAPTLAAGYSLTLPVDDGTSGQALTTNGSGVLSWATAGTTFPLLGSDGSDTAPTYSFSADTDSGMWRAAADNIVMTAGATNITQWVETSPGVGAFVPSTTNVMSLGIDSLRWLDAFISTVKVEAGTAALPSYTFRSDLNTGMYSSATDEISFATNGVSRLTIDNTGNIFPNSTSQSFGSIAGSNTWNNIYTKNTEFWEGGTQYGLINTASSNSIAIPSGALASMIVRSAQVSRNIALTTSNSTTSGTVYVESGNGTAGNSGDVSVQTGTATGIRGKIRLKDGSEGTAGHIWTSTDTTGAGGWAAPAGVTFPLLGSAGSAAAPTYSFSGDSDVGMYKSATNEISFATNGTLAFKILSTGGVQSTLDGYSFTSDTDTSINNPNDGEISFISNAAIQFKVSPEGLRMQNGIPIVGKNGSNVTVPIIKYVSAGENVEVGKHLTTSGSAPAVSACGTAPSVVGNDNAGRVTVGTGTVTSCTVTFNSTWTNAPVCTIGNETQDLFLAASASTTVLTITASATFDADSVVYHCIGY